MYDESMMHAALLSPACVKLDKRTIPLICTPQLVASAETCVTVPFTLGASDVCLSIHCTMLTAYIRLQGGG